MTVDKRRQVADIDTEHFKMIRQNIIKFMEGSAEDEDVHERKVLDIAPQDYEGARKYYVKSIVDTLDISPEAGATYTADLCSNNKDVIPDEYYDVIICTEVLEHVNNPFDAVSEMRRMLKNGGRLYISTPYNFRIHGPLPDNWRFTEHGLRALLVDFSSVEISPLDDPDRFLMPIHYLTKAIK